MSVSLTEMRELLLPGLQAIAMRECWITGWDAYGVPVTERIMLPVKTVSLPVAATMGAAAVIIKNPVVSRRFWR